MPQSCNVISAENIKELRDRSGAHVVECRDALLRCKGDLLLAEGYLKYYGCAINTYNMPHEEWAMKQAYGFKQDQLKNQ